MNWDDLKPFLELSRAGTLSAAARRLNVDHATVSRRIDALEAALKVRLFDRSPRGYTLTESGEALLPGAEAVERDMLALEAAITASDHTASGVVRLATPEAFGSQFLARHLEAFRAQCPGITLELVAETRPLSLSRREADIAITFARPESGRLVAAKLCDYRLQLYGTAGIAPVTSMDDLKTRDFIWYVDDLLQFDELRTLMSRTFKDPQVVFRSTSIAAQLNAARAGIGLALLHCFHACHYPDLIPVLPGEAAATRSLWLVTHEDLNRLPRIRAVTSFLQRLVEKNRSLLMGDLAERR